MTQTSDNPSQGTSAQLFRGQILHFLDDPTEADLASSYAYFADGGLYLEQGRVRHVGDWATVWATVQAQHPRHDLGQQHQQPRRVRLV
ncbi:MAG: hypothetical protein VXW65_01460, partial [Pseudomonadota bacterium]|nr:hypothetical protein [Pseudomonadota bacterium]